MTTRRYFVLLPALLALAFAACGGDEPPAPVRVENPTLGVAIAALPEGFEVTSTEGETIELLAAGANGDGRATISAGPVERGGINLVEATKERRAWFEATPGATYHGNRELGTPIGAAYTARGTYPTPDGDVEETWVYAIHPGANRLLTLRFTYPTGETGTRVEQLLLLLGEIEAAGG